MQISKEILEELEFSPGYCSKQYSDEKLGPGTTVVFKDHHQVEGFIFPAENFAQFADACKAIITFRFHNYYYPSKIEEKPEAPYTLEEIDATPEKLRKHVDAEMRTWSRRLQEARDNNYNVELAQVAMSDHEYSRYAAVLIIERRADYADEEWYFTQPLDPAKFTEKVMKSVERRKEYKEAFKRAQK